MFGPPGGVTLTSIEHAGGGFSVPPSWGMFPRTALQLLHRLQMGGSGADDAAHATVSVSAVEVYDNRIYDLLDGKKAIRVGGTLQTHAVRYAAIHNCSDPAICVQASAPPRNPRSGSCWSRTHVTPTASGWRHACGAQHRLERAGQKARSST